MVGFFRDADFFFVGSPGSLYPGSRDASIVHSDIKNALSNPIPKHPVFCVVGTAGHIGQYPMATEG